MSTAAELEKASADIALTGDARDALERAAELARERGAATVGPVDVLRAVLARRGSLADQAIRAVGVDPNSIAPLLTDDGEASLPLRQLLVNANREAQVLGHYQVDAVHLLLALLYSDSPATSAALQKAGLTLYEVRRHLQTGVRPDVPVAGARKSPPDRALRRKPLPSLRGVLSVSPIFIGLLVITGLTGLALWFDVLPSSTGVLTIGFVTAGWIASVCVHEFGHALVAYLGGDRSVVRSGYLTLDPLRYTNILMSIIFPVAFLLLGGIGLPGGAVYIDHSALRSRAWDSLVSIAGPAGTLLCGLLLASPFFVPGHLAWLTQSNAAFFAALAFLAWIEAVALVLNLLPIPGLDGFGIIRPWLPYGLQDLANRIGMVAIIGVFIVLWNVAPAREQFFNAVDQITNTVGVDPILITFGRAQMRLT